MSCSAGERPVAMQLLRACLPHCDCAHCGVRRVLLCALHLLCVFQLQRHQRSTRLVGLAG